jgi:predicted alpha/beta hydrolase family esterase
MKNAIILHGKPERDEYYDPKFPSASNSHWLPWLQKQLTVNNIKADTPEVPMAFDPQWDLWVKEVERFEITPNTILVGHSCGAGFWIRYLSEHKDLPVGRVVLVAPSLGKDWDRHKFFDFTIDPEISNRTKNITVFYSDNDKQAIIDTVKTLRGTIPSINIREFHGFGHFTYEAMKTFEFPELLTEVLA